MSYENNVNTYSSSGRVMQIDYAMNAVLKGTTTIGVALDDSVILVSEKKIVSDSMIPTSVNKHFKVYDNILCGYSGVSGDVGKVIKTCRKICCDYYFKFSEIIPIRKLMEKISSLFLAFGEKEKLYNRPLGVSFLFGSINKTPKLFCLDPSGSFISYKAKSIGSAAEVVDAELEKLPFSNTENTIKDCIKILGKAIKEDVSMNNIEVSILNDKEIKILSPTEISVYL